MRRESMSSYPKLPGIAPRRVQEPTVLDQPIENIARRH